MPVDRCLMLVLRCLHRTAHTAIGGVNIARLNPTIYDTTCVTSRSTSWFTVYELWDEKLGNQSALEFSSYIACSRRRKKFCARFGTEE